MADCECRGPAAAAPAAEQAIDEALGACRVAFARGARHVQHPQARKPLRHEAVEHDLRQIAAQFLERWLDVQQNSREQRIVLRRAARQQQVVSKHLRRDAVRRGDHVGVKLAAALLRRRRRVGQRAVRQLAPEHDDAAGEPHAVHKDSHVERCVVAVQMQQHFAHQLGQQHDMAERASFGTGSFCKWNWGSAKTDRRLAFSVEARAPCIADILTVSNCCSRGHRAVYSRKLRVVAAFTSFLRGRLCACRSRKMFIRPRDIGSGEQKSELGSGSL